MLGSEPHVVGRLGSGSLIGAGVNSGSIFGREGVIFGGSCLQEWLSPRIHYQLPGLPK